VAIEVHKFAVTIPAGTLQANAQVTNLTFPPREVTEVEIIVPPGPRGTVGFQLAAAGNQLLPYEPGAFFVTDNEQIRWRVEEQITSGAWQLIAYNTGQFAHTLEIRFLVDLIGPAVGNPAPVVPGPTLPLPPEQPAVLTGAQTPLAFLGFGG
jgi:hypothetical protein